MQISSTMKKKTAIILVLVLLIAAGIIVIKKKRAELERVPPPSKSTLLVNAIYPESGTFPETKRYLGTISAKISADIAPRIQGHLFEVRVREGQFVKKGDLLALLDDRQIRDRINELKARLAASKTAYQTQQGIFERDVKLFKVKAISQEQLDRSRSQRDAARAEVTILNSSLQSEETELSYSRLRAPFDGVITRRYQDPGDLAMVGRPVVSMEQPSAGYYIEIKVPQAEFPLMKKGARVFLINEKDDRRRAGHAANSLEIKISRVHPAVVVGTLATVEADVKTRPFGLPTGATITADIETGRVEGLKVPLRALLENVDSTFLFLVVRDNKVHVQKVNVLYKGSAWAVVKAKGIKPKTGVIVAQESALLRLHEGEKVRISSVKEGI